MSDRREEEPAMRLPMAIEEIDAGWLTAALRESHADARVTRLEVVDVKHGTCTKIRLRVAAQGIDLPGTLMLKGGFEPHSRDWHFMHETEVRGYRHILPALDLPHPQCWYAGFSAAQGQGIIVMEDLVASGVRFCSPVLGESVAAVRARLTVLARFHARSWRSARFAPGGTWDWLKDAMIDMRDYSQPFLAPDVWNHYVALPRGAAVSRRFHDAGWMATALERMAVFAQGQPHCVLHGDTHLGNLYVTADGTPGFFDSLPGTGPGISEVAYHMACGLDIADRREAERDLIAHYLAELSAAGVTDAPGLEEAIGQYAVYLARAYAVFIFNASVFQDEAVNTAYTARIGAAMLDHDTIGRLERIA